MESNEWSQKWKGHVDKKEEARRRSGRWTWRE